MSMFGLENPDHPHSPHQNPSDHSVADAALTILPRSAADSPNNAADNPRSESLIDPALREDRPKSSFITIATIPSHRQDSSMPHRVDPYPMSAQHRRDSYEVLHRRPSPPPIATLNHSPSPSIPQDRSAMSTPPARRTPPHQPLPGTLHTPAYYPHEPVMMQSSRHHAVPPPPPPPHYPPSRADSLGHSYGFSAHPSFDHRYEHGDGSNHHSSYHNTVGLPSHAPIPPVSHLPPGGGHGREAYSHSPYPLPGQNTVASIYTDDANTKLSDRVRRRCFNCCTTDTSTWRRSNLSPGKVLCNKCGLFERTHSRPRPEQFPHKRGPLTGTALNSSSGNSAAGRSRTPPTNQLPPISSPSYSYSHPSIAPLNNVQDHHNRRDYQMNTSLPGLQSWHPHPSHSSHPSHPPPHHQSHPHPSSHPHITHASQPPHHSHNHPNDSPANTNGGPIVGPGGSGGPISLPPPSSHAQQNGGGHGQQTPILSHAQAPSSIHSSSQAPPPPPPPLRRDTTDSSPGTRPSSPRPSVAASGGSARPSSSELETRDSPKSV